MDGRDKTDEDSPLRIYIIGYCSYLYIYEKFKCTKCGGGRVICKVYKIPKVRYSFRYLDFISLIIRCTYFKLFN